MKNKIKGAIENVRMFLTFAFCLPRYRQCFYTAMAARVRHDGHEKDAEVLEACANILHRMQDKGIGRKFVHVEVTCECGVSAFARSGEAPWKPGNVCPERPPIRLPVNGE
jgi:hypothetical protein